MIVLNYKPALAVLSLLVLAACVPPPASGGAKISNAETPPLISDTDTKTTPVQVEETQVVETKPESRPAQIRARSSSDLRIARQSLDEISLWQTEEDEKKSADPAIWYGAQGKDVAVILPAIVNSSNKRVQNITRQIAMSAVGLPEGMDGMAYARWRADVLSAQNRYADAARLLNVASIGRRDQADVESRIALQLANNQTETACLEAMATRNMQATAFWQGLEVLCAGTLGDADAAENLRASLPEGELKDAAEKMGSGKNTAPLRAALVSAASAKAESKTIADNEMIVRRLKRLMYEIKDEEANTEAMIDANRGQLLLLSMGALSAEKKDEDTDKVTKEALGMVGL